MTPRIVTSTTWDGPHPDVSVVVSTYRRAHYLTELVGALEAQELDAARFEVVVVDNGSGDDTWAALEAIAGSTPLRLLALRLEANRGPGGGRNAGAELTRAPLIAITDDDCLPAPAWLGRMVAAFDDPAVAVVQGMVLPDPRHHPTMGPWDHTIGVGGPTPFFETANVGYRRTAFEAAGGFDEADPLLHPPSGRAFGEDACLGWSVVSAGGRSGFAAGAVVHHRVVPSTFGRWLADQRQLRLFPGLVRRAPLVERIFWRRVFLTRASAAFDLAVLGVVLAAVLRRPALTLAALPWLRMRVRALRPHAGGDPRVAARLLAQWAVSDATALAALARGSVEHRRLLL